MEEIINCKPGLLLEQNPEMKAEVGDRGAFMLCQIFSLEMVNPFLFSHPVSGICI